MSSFLRSHGAHLIVLGGPFLLMAAMFGALQLDRTARRHPATSPLSAVLALCWVASATIHLTVISHHFDDGAVLGAFFLVLTALQYAYALALTTRESRRLLTVGLLANVGLVALWAYTRLVNVPFGLGPREQVGVADVTATAFEAVAVVLAAVVVRRRRSAGGVRELLATGTAVRGGGRDPVAVVHGRADSAVVA